MLVRLLCLGLAMAVLPPAATAAAPVIGIGEEHTAPYSDARLRWLPFTAARTVVPLDVASADPDRVDAWLAAVADAKLEPHVAFTKPTTCGSPCAPVGPVNYRRALDAFRARWPQVRVFTPWNEANHPSQPTGTRPDLAAAYHRVLREACPDCTGPGLDVVDLTNMTDYVGAYRRYAGTDPAVWGLHNFGDVNGASGSTRRLLQLVQGELWLTESAGIVELTRVDGTRAYDFDENRAGRATRRLWELAESSSRITRVHLYQWAERPWELWDSAPVRYDSSLRPAFDVLAEWLRPGETPPPLTDPDAILSGEPPAPAPDGARTEAPAGPALAAAVAQAFERPLPAGLGHLPLDVARPAAVAWLRAGRAVVALRCPASAPAGCRGTVGVCGRHPLPAALRAVRSAGFRLGPGATGTVRVRLPRALARRIRHRLNKKLVVSIRNGSSTVWTGVLPVRRGVR